MIIATSPEPYLCSTSVVDDAYDQDDVVGIKLSYSYNDCFFTVLIGTDFCQGVPVNKASHESTSTINDFISRFNDACTVTEKDRSIADFDERLDCLWHEAEAWIREVVFEKIKCLGKRHGRSSLRITTDGRKLGNLTSYLYPQCFNLQLVPVEVGFGAVLRSDLDPCLPFAVEPNIQSDSTLMRFDAQHIEVLYQSRAHVLKVRTNLGIFCCKLNNSGGQNSFLREFNTLKEIGRHLPECIKIPRLRGTVEVGGGVMGFLTDWVDTEDSNLMVLLDQEKDIPASMKKKWADQISKTVHLLHSHNITWGDAKTSNVLIDRDGNAWLIDFGGGFTQGWVDESLYDTQQGDLQGVGNTLLDIFGNR